MNSIKLYRYFSIFLFVIILLSHTIGATNCWIRDEDNRAIIFHGLNISNAAKRTENQISWHTFEDYERMTFDWGFNCIRLLIFWSAIEPEPGVFNESYLDLVAERVSWAEDLGMYVILDMHQDLFSEKFGGDGAPLWAVWDDGFEFRTLEPWWLNYIQPAVRRTFKNFWTAEELKNHFISSWIFVAERFNESSAVIGYEIINEPYFGTFLPWTFEKTYLKDFYLDVVSGIRTVDLNHYFFYEPQIMTNSGFKSYLPSLETEKVVYAPHFYLPTVHEGLPYLGLPFFIKRALSMRNSEAEDASVAWLLGEFGVNKDVVGRELYLKYILGMLNSYTASWTYWSYDYGSNENFGIINESGCENPQLNILVYPYPQKIAGDPKCFNYNYKTKSFSLEFFENGSSEGPSEIYVGKSRIYPDGFNVYCSDLDGSWSWEYVPTYEKVLVWTNSTDDLHKIEIKPN